MLKITITESLVPRALCQEVLVCKSIFDFRDFLHPDTFFGVDQRSARTLNYFGNLRRAVHVQSFQSPCTCTRMRRRIFSSTASERANQELQNAFLDEFLAQKEAEIRPVKVGTLFAIFAHFARANCTKMHKNARKSQKVYQL